MTRAYRSTSRGQLGRQPGDLPARQPKLGWEQKRPWVDYIAEALADGKWKRRSDLLAEVLRAAAADGANVYAVHDRSGRGGRRATVKIRDALVDMDKDRRVERRGENDAAMVRLIPPTIPPPPIGAAVASLAPYPQRPRPLADPRDQEAREAWGDRPRSGQRWWVVPDRDRLA